MNKLFDFPYPVLKYTDDSGYNENIKLKITDIETKYINDFYEIDITIENNSSTIMELINKNICAYYITYTTKNISETLIVNDNNYILKIPIWKLESDDKIEIILKVISETDFELLWTDEMDQVYNLGEKYIIRKKDILAISNTLNYSYNISGDTILKIISKDNDDHKGLKIDILENYIYVTVSKEFNKYYQSIIIKDEKKGLVKEILNSSLVYIVLINVFIKLLDLDYRNSCKNYRWYNIINNSFSHKEINFENRLNEIQIEDIDDLYNLVEEFMNYYYDRAIIKTGERIGKYDD